MQLARPWPRSRAARSSSLFLSAALLTTGVHAQGASVWVLDEGGGPGVDFTVLQDALDSAADGDIVLVRDGRYDPPPAFPPLPTTLTGKGLTLTADVGAAPVVGGLVVEDLPVGRSVVLSGLDFDATLEVDACAGTVWIEDADLAPPSFIGLPLPLLVQDSDDVIVSGSTLHAGQQILVLVHGLDARGSNVVLADCTLEGAQGYGSSSQGGDGLVLTDGTLFATNTTFTGGGGGCGGNGLALSGNDPAASSLGCTFEAGLPGICTTGVLGVDVLDDAGTWTALPGSARSFTADSPASTGTSVSVAYAGLPGDLVIGLYSFSTATTSIPALRGVLFVPLDDYALTLLGTAGAGGDLALSVPLPQSQTAGARLTLQAAAFQPGLGFTLTGPASLVKLAP